MTTKHDRKDHNETTASAKTAEEAEPKLDVEPSEPAAESKPKAMIDEVPGAHGVMAFARKHPLVTVLGVAGVGLFGGVEIAAAMLVGAGVAAIVGRGEAAPQAHVVRERARSFLAKKPEIKNRARAVVDAVRGRIHSNGHNA